MQDQNIKSLKDELSSGLWHLDFDIEHPILRNHLVYKQPILPGLAWIDIFYQWLSKLDLSFKHYTLSNLFIFRPLVVSYDKPVELILKFNELNNGWNVTIWNKQDGEINRYVTAEMLACKEVSFQEYINLDKLIKQYAPVKPLSSVYERCRSQQLYHSDIMLADGWILDCKDAFLAKIKIDSSFLNKADNCIFHPALIDACGIASTEVFELLTNQPEQLYLPLYYGSFKASSKMIEACYVRIRMSEAKFKQEIITLTLEFFNHKGDKIAELTNFKNKLVRHPDLIAPDINLKASSHIADALIPDLDRCDNIESFLTLIIAKHIKLPVEDINVDLGYYELGLSSTSLLEVVNLLENILETSFSPTLLFEHTTISNLAKYLEENYSLQCKNIFLSKKETHQPNELSMPSESTFLDNYSGALQLCTHTPLCMKLDELNKHDNTQHDIAIIGMSGKYPMADNLDEFWQNLCDGKDCISEIPSERWDYKQFDALKSPSGKKISKWGGFITDADCFDAAFFNISPRDASNMDPQERLFLQACWSAMEDAGYTPENITKTIGKYKRKPVGVFVGVMHKDYTLLQAEVGASNDRMQMSLSYAPIANRVSYFCDFHGPSMAIDTVCSSSLVALHLAVQSLIRGESKVAFAGGVNLSLHPSKYITYNRMDMHASDGYCHTFGEGGDGYVSADGIGSVLLKPLDDAIRDSDHIYAIIKATATNHVGKASGITVPSPVAQGDMIAQCIRTSGIDPETISYIEAHGTGTILGDPIEIQGLKQAFSQFTQKKHFCAIGSVKSNIGHAESAAGISGLIKAVLQLHHKTLVKSLHAEVINKYLGIEDSPFFVQQITEPWNQNTKTLRRAGVSSFGASGSNVHVILEEASQPENKSIAKSAYLIVISAKTESSYQQKIVDMIHWLDDPRFKNVPLQDISFTLSLGRRHFKYRGAWVVTDRKDLKNKLQLSQDNQENYSIVSKIVNNKIDIDAQSKLETLVHSLAQNIMRSAEYQQTLEEFSQYYLKGYSIPWDSLFENEACHRVSLPTYPFAKKRYWLPIERKIERSQLEPTSTTLDFDNFSHPESDISLAYYKPYWEATTLPNMEQLSPPLTIVAFVNKATVFSSPGVNCIRVEPGENYQCIAKDYYRIRAGLQSDYIQLFSDITKDYPQSDWQYVVSAWGLESRENQGELEDWLARELHQGIYHLLGVSQGLLSQHVKRVRLLHLYRYHEGTLTLDPMNTSFIKTIQEEQPEYIYSVIGLDLLSVVKHSDLFSELILPELQVSRTAFIQYMDGRRYERQFSKLEVSNADAYPRAVRLRSHGVYLITGGLGGLGFLFSRYLAKHYGAKLLLTGRSVLDSEKQSKIAALEALGAEVHYESVDVSDRASVQELMGVCQRRFGELNGIIHAAGLAARSFVQDEQVETIERLSRAKINASIYLDEYSRDQPLDFMVLFSSISSHLMNASLTAYGSVNAFLNYFADYREYWVEQGKRRGRICWSNVG
jgi:polyketide synthase PksL